MLRDGPAGLLSMRTVGKRQSQLVSFNAGWYYRAFYQVDPDTDNSDPAGNVVVLRVFSPGRERKALTPSHPPIATPASSKR